MATVLNKKDQKRLETAQQELTELISEASTGIDDPQAARLKAKQALDQYQETAVANLSQASERFKLLQRVEYVIGAAVVAQVVIFMLILKSQSVPLAISSSLTVVLYVIAAVLDSKAKGKRQDIHFQIQAAKKAKLRNGDAGVIIEFD
jgi:hypothetical protein